MREKRTTQSSEFEQYAEHEIGRELQAMSDWLDENRVQRKVPRRFTN